MSLLSRNGWIAVAVVGIGAAVAVKAAVSRRSQAPGEAGPFVIKTWTRKDCSVTPWTVADRKGFLAAEGIKLELTGETQPALQIPSILRGDNDVSSFHPNTIAVAQAGGAQITGVAEGDIDPADPSVDPKYRHMWWFVNPQKYPDVHSFADKDDAFRQGELRHPHETERGLHRLLAVALVYGDDKEVVKPRLVIGPQILDLRPHQPDQRRQNFLHRIAEVPIFLRRLADHCREIDGLFPAGHAPHAKDGIWRRLRVMTEVITERAFHLPFAGRDFTFQNKFRLGRHAHRDGARGGHAHRFAS